MTSLNSSFISHQMHHSEQDKHQFNKENQLFNWKSGNLDEYRAKIRSQFQSPHKERHERQLTEIQNLQKTLRSSTPKKRKVSKQQQQAYGNSRRLSGVPRRRSSIAGNKPLVAKPKKPTSVKKSAFKKTTTSLNSSSSNIRRMSLARTPNKDGRPKTPKREVPDFQKRFQLLHEKEQQRLAKFQSQNRRKSTVPAEFNLSSGRQMTAMERKEQNQKQNQKHELLDQQQQQQQQQQFSHQKSEQTNLDTSMIASRSWDNHPAQQQIEFEVDPSSLHAILNSRFNPQTNRVEVPDNGNNLNDSQMLRPSSAFSFNTATTSSSSNNTDLNTSVRHSSIKSLTRVSLGPPERVKRSARPSTYNRVYTTLDRIGMSPSKKKEYQDIITKSASKNASTKKRPTTTESFTSNGVVRNLFAESMFGLSDIGTSAPGMSTIVSLYDNMEAKPSSQTNEDSVRESSQNNTTKLSEKIAQEATTQTEKMDEDFDILLSPTTRKIIQSSKTVIASRVTSSKKQSLLARSARKQTPAVPIFEMDDDPELTSLISRITSQSPVKLTPIRLLTGKKPTVDLEAGGDQFYCAKVNITPHDRTGAQNPVSKILSSEQLAKDQHMVHSPFRSSAQRMLDFTQSTDESADENNAHDVCKVMKFSPSTFVSLEDPNGGYYGQPRFNDTQEVHLLLSGTTTLSTQEEDSMVMSPGHH